jgi:hypothetical protein
LHHDRASALHAARRCGLSFAAAALILRTDIDRAMGNFMRGLGDYHSATPQLSRLYRDRVWAIASRLFGMHK